MQSHANNRASLLANLRTGGVRSSSGAGVPHTAAPGGSFQIPRFASQSHGYGNGSIYEDDEDLLAAQMQQMAFGGNSAMGPRGMMNGGAPMTASHADPNRFQQQQQQMMMMQMLQNQGGMGGFNGAMGGLNSEQQLLQLQLQNEILTLQAKQQQQQQQFQAQILAQAQAQQQAQLQAQIQAAQAAQQAQSGLTNNSRLNSLITRRVSAANTAVPSTAGPLTTTFNLGNGPTPRRAMSIDQDSGIMQPPMTAGLGGRFGARAPSLSGTTALNPNAAAFSFGGRLSSPVKEKQEDQFDRDGATPPTPMTATYASTTVISGGTSLGGSVQPSNNTAAISTSPSKANSALSWRRPSVATTTTSPPGVTRQLTSSPPFRDQSPVSAGSRDNSRVRPQPLRFNSGLSNNVEAAQSAPSSPEPDVVATSADGVQTILVDNGHSTGSRSPASNSPTTPVGGEPLPASREEASKRLYESLGLGRPIPGQHQSQLASALGSNPSLTSLSGTSTPARTGAHPVRQPRGPPTDASELGPRNFASRVRSKAIGGLEAMIMARNRRQGLDVEAF